MRFRHGVSFTTRTERLRDFPWYLCSGQVVTVGNMGTLARIALGVLGISFMVFVAFFWPTSSPQVRHFFSDSLLGRRFGVLASNFTLPIKFIILYYLVWCERIAHASSRRDDVAGAFYLTILGIRRSPLVSLNMGSPSQRHLRNRSEDDRGSRDLVHL